MTAMDKDRKIQAALDVLSLCAPGDWWCDHHELLNDAIGNVKIAKYVSGWSQQQTDAHRVLLSAARDLAEEVVRLRKELGAVR